MQQGYDLLLVLLPKSGAKGSQDCTNISHHGETEGNANDSKENAEESPGEGDRGHVSIANSGEDGGGEEDRLDVVPADGVVLGHHVDPSSHGLINNTLVVTKQSVNRLKQVSESLRVFVYEYVLNISLTY